MKTQEVESITAKRVEMTPLDAWGHLQDVMNLISLADNNANMRLPPEGWDLLMGLRKQMMQAAARRLRAIADEIARQWPEDKS